MRQTDLKALAARVSAQKPRDTPAKNAANVGKKSFDKNGPIRRGVATDSQGLSQPLSDLSQREIALLRDLACSLTYQERQQLRRDAEAGDPLSARIVEAIGPPPLP